MLPPIWQEVPVQSLAALSCLRASASNSTEHKPQAAVLAASALRRSPTCSCIGWKTPAKAGGSDSSENYLLEQHRQPQVREHESLKCEWSRQPPTQPASPGHQVPTEVPHCRHHHPVRMRWPGAHRYAPSRGFWPVPPPPKVPAAAGNNPWTFSLMRCENEGSIPRHSSLCETCLMSIPAQAKDQTNCISVEGSYPFLPLPVSTNYPWWFPKIQEKQSKVVKIDCLIICTKPRYQLNVHRELSK